MSASECLAIVQKEGKLFQEAIPVPTPSAHQVLVKVSYVAQNPTDGMPSMLVST